MRVTTRNARFQLWEALLSNRSKRQKRGEFLVQGVRPITLAVQHGWQVRTLLFNADIRLSDWAAKLLDGHAGEQVAMSSPLLAELGGKDSPELVAVVALPSDDLNRIEIGARFLAVVFDRPASPGNIGTLTRSADALGAQAVITTGHGSDPYDPAAIRASTGSMFALATVRADSPRQVVDWIGSAGKGVQILGTDETGEADIADCDLRKPTLLLVGNETNGLSRAWRDSVDVMARIPITGAASSLNAASAASIVLYEAARQRAA